MHIIVEGIDHCGKDTLIEYLQNVYGGRVVHSGKPALLKKYNPASNPDSGNIYKELILSHKKLTLEDQVYASYIDHPDYEDEELKTNAMLYMYQKNYFESLFNSMVYSPDATKNKISFTGISKTLYNVFYNRFHLGEYVYGRLYRNYTTNMMMSVFASEQKFLEQIPDYRHSDYYLILLLMHNPLIRVHDPDAFNFDRGSLEQELFLEAFNLSRLQKSVVFVDTPEGEWRPVEEIRQDVEAYLFR